MSHLVPNHVLVNASRIAHGVHGTGTPVVLMHGTPSSSFIWRNIVPALVAAGHQVHVYDLLGYGLSERPQDPAIDTSVTAQVSVLEGLLEHWGLETAHIISHDIGGGVAQSSGPLTAAHKALLTDLDLNTGSQSAIDVDIEDSVMSIAKRFASQQHQYYYRGFPVMKNNRVVGRIILRDVLRAMSEMSEEHVGTDTDARPAAGARRTS